MDGLLPPKGLRIRNFYIPDLHVDSTKMKTRDFRWRSAKHRVRSATSSLR